MNSPTRTTAGMSRPYSRERTNLHSQRTAIALINAFQEKDYTYEETQRGLWHSAMVGGVANIWGNLQFDKGGSYDEGSRAYPSEDELKLYSDFMTPKFSADLQLCNALTDRYCLRTPEHTQYIVYKEEQESISIDLSAMSGGSQYTAINTITDESVDSMTKQVRHWCLPAPAQCVYVRHHYQPRQLPNEHYNYRDWSDCLSEKQQFRIVFHRY